MAAEFFGTCQICGRQQKAHPHALAKHGYTIRFGWQMGECYGSGAKPYEISNDRLLSAIDAAHEYIARTKEKIAALEANPLKEDGTVWGNYSEQRFGETRSGPLTVSMGEKGVEARDRNGRIVYLSGHYRDVAHAVRDLANKQIAEMESSIRDAEFSIPYMQKRHDEWTPGVLVPVTDADRAATKIKVHFEAKKYGRTTGVCVASAMGASAYKQTTTDRSKVTCAACLKELARIDDLPRLKAEQAEKDRLRGIKEAQRDMKMYAKWIKGGGTDEEILHWTKCLTIETDKLESLTAAAPAAQ